MAANELTPQEKATLKVFSSYASKAGKPGSKAYNARLSDLIGSIRYEMAKTKKPLKSETKTNSSRNSNSKALVESKEKVGKIRTISGQSFRRTEVNGKTYTFKAEKQEKSPNYSYNRKK